MGRISRLRRRPIASSLSTQQGGAVMSRSGTTCHLSFLRVERLSTSAGREDDNVLSVRVRNPCPHKWHEFITWRNPGGGCVNVRFCPRRSVADKTKTVYPFVRQSVTKGFLNWKRMNRIKGLDAIS